jgi:hypothetical protein
MGTVNQVFSMIYWALNNRAHTVTHASQLAHIKEDNMPRTREISNIDDVIDSRDVIARIEELEGIDEPDDDERDELNTLKELAEEAEGYSPDWAYGSTLIRDSYFKDYAMELAEDIGAIPDNLQWPCTCIDWDQAARELQMDYTSVEFGDVTYWVQ